MNKYIIYFALFSMISLSNLYGVHGAAQHQRRDGIGPATGREFFRNEAEERAAGGAYYGGYGGVYMPPNTDIDPSQTEIDNSYYEALEHPPEMP